MLMYKIEYSELLRNAKMQKKRKETHLLNGEARRLVYHVLSDIIESIEIGKFRNRTNKARIKLYQITVSYNNRVLVESIRRYSIGIKTFHFQSRVELKSGMDALNYVLKKIGLESEIKEDGDITTISLFHTQCEREP